MSSNFRVLLEVNCKLVMKSFSDGLGTVGNSAGMGFSMTESQDVSVRNTRRDGFFLLVTMCKFHSSGFDVMEYH